MIDTNDLKLGNYVAFEKSNGSFELVQVNSVFRSGISFDGFIRETGNPDYPYEVKIKPREELMPVPLNDNLIAYGLCLVKYPNNGETRFFFSGKRSTYFLGKDYESGKYFIGIDFRGEVIHCVNNLEYLHELQNAYYSIYRSEMDIIPTLLAKNL
jgi:hypothetical protein|nr:MAG TPA: hypothetical protein [Caudoviricetes sp.]